MELKVLEASSPILYLKSQQIQGINAKWQMPMVAMLFARIFLSVLRIKAIKVLHKATTMPVSIDLFS